MRTIYLDYNATTPIAPAVREAMLPFLTEHYGNPASGHVLGRAAHEAVEQARAQVAEVVGAEPAEIVFTSGGTEGNNLAIKGAAWRRAPAATGHLVISAIEHPAVVEPARFLERLGYGLTIVACDARGVVDPASVRAAIRGDTFLVSVMHANNEVGSRQPIREIAAICRSRGVWCHADAAQSIGKVPVRVDELGVDLLTIAGHKCYAPKGVGALYVRRGVDLEPVLHGAAHEGGQRAGTENVASIVGLGKAAAMVARNLGDTADRMERLRNRLQIQMCEALGGSIAVHATGAERLPNTLSISFAGVDGQELLRRCPELCASTGAACHSGSTRLSATLAAMGVTPESGQGTIRLSVGWYTTEEEVDRATSLLVSGYEALR
jgi:cysteine desulfurase